MKFRLHSAPGFCLQLASRSLERNNSLQTLVLITDKKDAAVLISRDTENKMHHLEEATCPVIQEEGESPSYLIHKQFMIKQRLKQQAEMGLSQNTDWDLLKSCPFGPSSNFKKAFPLLFRKKIKLSFPTKTRWKVSAIPQQSECCIRSALWDRVWYPTGTCMMLPLQLA